METSLQFADRKTELEAQITSFEREKAALLAEIPALKERLTTLELEGQAKSLANEVAILKDEKTNLEQRIAAYGQPAPAEAPAAGGEPTEPPSQPTLN